MSKLGALSLLEAILCLLPSCRSVSTDANGPETGKESQIVERRTVPLLYDSLAGGRFIRFSGETASITVRVDDAIKYFRRHFREHQNLTREKLLADRFQAESSIRSEYLYEDFPWDERDRLRYCIAALLDEGKSVVKLPDEDRIVSEIVVCKYAKIRGALDGIDGRQYLLPDGRVFYHVVDIIY